MKQRAKSAGGSGHAGDVNGALRICCVGLFQCVACFDASAAGRVYLQYKYLQASTSVKYTYSRNRLMCV